MIAAVERGEEAGENKDPHKGAGAEEGQSAPLPVIHGQDHLIVQIHHHESGAAGDAGEDHRGGGNGAGNEKVVVRALRQGGPARGGVAEKKPGQGAGGSGGEQGPEARLDYFSFVH